MLAISGSVGRSGTNRPQDVRTVQTLLNQHRTIPFRHIGVDGILGPETIGAIEEFQRRVVKMSAPDGRVDLGGRTWMALTGGAVATASLTAWYLMRKPRPQATTRLQWMKAGSGISTYAGGMYCGPGWGFTREDVISGRIKELPQAIDSIDAACQRHDQCYESFGYLTQQCNVALASDLVRVIRDPKSTEQQVNDALVMAAIFAIEAATVDEAVADYRAMKQKIEFLWNTGRATMEQVIRAVTQQLKR